METPNRLPKTALKWLQRIAKSPFDYDFHTVIRSIECLFPMRDRLAESQSIDMEIPIRLGQAPFVHVPRHSFDPLDIPFDQITTQPIQMNTFFFGLFGPQGPLPIHITERMLHHTRNKDTASPALQFINIFQHRLLSLYYRIWSQVQATTQLDRADSQGVLLTLINSLSGSLTHTLHPTFAIARNEITQQALQPDSTVQNWPDCPNAYFSGFFNFADMPIEGVRAILGAVMQCSIRIERFMPRWAKLSSEDYFHLGQKSLGIDTLLGEQVLTAQHQLRIVIDAKSWQHFQTLQPGESQFQRLSQWLNQCLGNGFDWTLVITLKPSLCPSWQLGTAGKLGSNQWLLTCDRGQQASRTSGNSRTINTTFNRHSTEQDVFQIEIDPNRLTRTAFRENCIATASTLSQ